MGEQSKIEWTTHTFNPWLGCTKVSPGCDHCYAEALMDRRYHRVRWGDGERVRTSPANWRKPRTWNKAAGGRSRPRVFCASLADVFDNAAPHEWRADLFALIRETPNLDWLLLTKRIGNAPVMLPDDWGDGWPHVWIGATMVNQQEVDRDLSKLLAVPARLRFVSFEPLLEAVDLSAYLEWGAIGPPWFTAPSEHPEDQGPQNSAAWVIVGGESGPGARPFRLEHARRLVQQCADAGVPCFVKQLGARPYEYQQSPYDMSGRTQFVDTPLRLRHPKGGDIDEWPTDLRVREFPRA